MENKLQNVFFTLWPSQFLATKAKHSGGKAEFSLQRPNPASFTHLNRGRPVFMNPFSSKVWSSHLNILFLFQSLLCNILLPHSIHHALWTQHLSSILPCLNLPLFGDIPLLRAVIFSRGYPPPKPAKGMWQCLGTLLVVTSCREGGRRSNKHLVSWGRGCC